jgi:acyl-CoA synthetase (AMP-forming)/AMP-acid ligase II
MLLHHFLEKTVERFPHKEALICNDRRLTFSEIENFANCLGNALIAAGLQRLDRVAIYLENSVESVISIFGILKASGIFIIINPQVKTRKLEYILNDCQVKFLITDAKLVSNYTGNCPSLNLVILIEEKPDWKKKQLQTFYFWDLIKQARTDRPLNNCIDIDLCSLIYTSGSTGNPKGVMLTHLNMVSAANSIIEYLENTSEDIIINFLPLSFDYGLYNILMPFYFGGTVILEKSFLYPYQLIGLVNKEKVTGLPLVPTIISYFLKFQDLKKYKFPSLRYITSTGQALPPKHIYKLSELFPKVNIYSMYGLTECKRVAYLPPKDLLRKPDSVGRAIPNVEAYIVNENGDRITQPGMIGELIVRGSNIMEGYWNLPEETAKVLEVGASPGQKVLRTGDLFKMDKEYYLYFIARKDDLIKTGGELVSPKEVESIIYELEEVKEVVVFGVEHEILGQVIKVSLVLGNNSKLVEKDIIDYCSLFLEKSMIPKYVEIRSELPKTITGKISHKELLSEMKSSHT